GPLSFSNSRPITGVTPPDGQPSTTVGPNPILLRPAPQGPEDARAVPQYPYGGFARGGDMLSVPFIGAHRITYQLPLGSTFTVGELNSVTMDSVFAEDTDVNDDPQPGEDTGLVEREQLGRFCPIRSTSAFSGPVVPDYNNQ